MNPTNTPTKSAKKQTPAGELDKLAASLGLPPALAASGLHYAAQQDGPRVGVPCKHDQFLRWDRASRLAGAASFVGWVAETLERAASITAAEKSDHPTRPPGPGFYWWRPHDQDAWQVLEVRADRARDGALYVRQDSEDLYQASDDPAHPWRGQWCQTALTSPVEKGGQGA